MSIIKRQTPTGPKYVPAVYIGKNPDTGKSMYEYGSRWDLRRDAAKEEAKIQALVRERSRNGATTKMPTFAQIVKEFQQAREFAHLAARTQDDYQYYLTRVILPVFGDMKATAITYTNVQAWVDEMEKDWSAATLVKPFRQFKNILSYAVKRGYLPYNPCADVDLPTISTAKALRSGSQVKTWTPDQISTFLNWEAVQASKYFPMLLISFTTAARPGEVCGVWASGFDGEFLTFENGLDTKGRITNLKNEWAHRKVYAGPQVAKAIKAIQLWQLKCKLLLGRAYLDDGHLFRQETGAPIRPDVYSKAFADLLKRYNEEHRPPLPVIPLYNARHSWATNARGVYHLDPEIVASVMGHSTINTAFENYVVIGTDRLRDQMPDVM